MRINAINLNTKTHHRRCTGNVGGGTGLENGWSLRCHHPRGRVQNAGQGMKQEVHINSGVNRHKPYKKGNMSLFKYYSIAKRL